MKIEVIVKEVGKPARIELIENELEMFQKLVGGYIECVPFGVEAVDGKEKLSVCLICDEEGKLKGKKKNFLWCDSDYIVGTAVFVGDEGENFRGLTDKELNALKGYFLRNDGIFESNIF